MFGFHEVRHRCFTPDDDRDAGSQVERKLVGVVEPQVVAKVAGTGLDGSSVPDETEVSPEFSDELIGQERTHVSDVVLSQVLVPDAVEVEPYAVYISKLIQIHTLLRRQVAGDDDPVPLPVPFAMYVGSFRIECREVIENTKRDERLFGKTLAHQVRLHFLVVTDDVVRRADESGLFKVDTQPLHEGKFARVLVAHGLEVVDEECDRDASFPKIADEVREQCAVGPRRELQEDTVALLQTAQLFLPEAVVAEGVLYRAEYGLHFFIRNDDVNRLKTDGGQDVFYIVPGLASGVLPGVFQRVALFQKVLFHIAKKPPNIGSKKEIGQGVVYTLPDIIT